MMNERIRELFKTIRKYKHTYNLMSNPPQVRYNYTIEEQDIEKFAKLIIQECGVALSPMLRDMISRGQAYDMIKQHFGIE
jgi:sulfite reductase beta subunit-like hemoprotein